jgi:hypothetical protein
MSYSRGILNAIYRKEDQEAELARFNAQLLEKRKTTLIPALMERIGNYKESADESKARVSQAEQLGFSREAAVILEVDGQLGMHLEKLSVAEKNNKLNKEQLKKISKTIVDSVGEDEVSAAMNYILQGDLSFSGLTDGADAALLAIWNSGSQEEFLEKYGDVARSLGTTPRPEVNPLEFTNRPAINMSLSDRASANNNIRANVAATLGVSLNYDEGGNVVGFQGEDADQAQIVLNNALDVYENLYNNPLHFGNPTETITNIANTIQKLRQNGNTIANIAANPTFDLNFSPTTSLPPPNNLPPTVLPRTVDDDDDGDDDDALNE